MRYFAYMAEQSFKIDSEGRRVFYLGSPFSRPYLIPDSITESCLLRKLTWYYRVFLSTLIIGLIFLVPYIIREPWIFFAILGGVVALQWMIIRLVFFTDLRMFPRASARLSLRIFFAGMAERHSERALLLGLLGSLAFVIAGVIVSFGGGGLAAVGITAVVFFCACAGAWGYALRLKRAQKIKS